MPKMGFDPCRINSKLNNIDGRNRDNLSKSPPPPTNTHKRTLMTWLNSEEVMFIGKPILFKPFKSKEGRLSD